MKPVVAVGGARLIFLNQTIDHVASVLLHGRKLLHEIDRKNPNQIAEFLCTLHPAAHEIALRYLVWLESPLFKIKSLRLYKAASIVLGAKAQIDMVRRWQGFLEPDTTKKLALLSDERRAQLNVIAHDLYFNTSARIGLILFAHEQNRLSR